MKIAIVLNTSWNIYNFRMGLIRVLQTAGHEIHTIAPIDDYTHYLTDAGCIHHPVKMDRRGANPIRDLALTVELFLIYLKLKPSIILHFTIKPNVYGSFAAALLRIPTINNVCGLGTVFLKNNLVSAIAIFLYRISFQFPQRVFFQNGDDLELFVRRKLIAKDKADLLPGSGIDLKKFGPIDFRRNKQFTFLMISRIIAEKGVLEYVAAAKILLGKGISVKFQILGAKDPEHNGGVQVDVIDGWVKSGVIEYLGTTDRVQDAIANCDCVVLPSYREGTPRALLEAAASAKPIIATNVPGCRQIVHDNLNGLLCRVKDADDLAAKMLDMISMDDETLIHFGKIGRRIVESNYNENVVFQKYLEVIGERAVTADPEPLGVPA